MIAICLIAGIVAVVWGLGFAWRGSLVLGCLAYLLVAACFGHGFLHFHLGPVPLTLDRIVLAVLAVSYVVQRRLGRVQPKPVGRTDLMLFGLLAVLILSGTLAGWGRSRASLDGQFGPVFRLVAGYLMPVVAYWIARQSPLDRFHVSLVQGTLACLGVYLAASGLLEISGQWWAVFPKHIADPDVGIHFGRARGPMVHSVSFGLYLAVCMVAAWVWRWRLGRVGQLLILATVPLMLAAIFFSYTRSVWLGAAFAVLVVLFLSLRGSWRPLVLGGLISAAGLLAVTRMDRLVYFQREDSGQVAGRSVQLRASFAYVSWRMFLDRPLCGFGFGRFPEAKLPYLSDHSTNLDLEMTRPYVHHNTLLSVLTETGLVGFLLLGAVLFGWARAGWRLCRDPNAPDWARAQGVLLLGALAVYLCQLGFHELSYTPIDNSLIFFLGGITVGLRAPRQAETPAARVPNVRLGYAAAG